MQETIPWEAVRAEARLARSKSCNIDVFARLDPDHKAANVDLPRKERAGLLAREIWEESTYRFNVHRTKALRNNAEEFEWECAQREGAQTKPKKYTDDILTQRERDYMTRFTCGGMMRMTVNDEEPDVVRIRVTHKCKHIAYVDISPSERIRERVHEWRDLPPSQIWKGILKEFPDTEMSENQVYALWLAENQQQWRLDPDQVISAQKVVEQAAGRDVELIVLREEPGMAALAFALKEPMRLWGKDTTEIAFDGTFNTNAAGYELSALVAEGNGQAVPLGFILTISTDGTATTGAKHRILLDFLQYFRQRCPNVKFTLSDKERAEIDALRETFPDAKHNCCYWHAIHYLEIRLAEDKPPALYDPRKANRIHSFIDPTWAPGVAATEDDAEHELHSGSAVNRGARETAEEIAAEQEVVRATCRPPTITLIASTGKRIPIYPRPPVVKKADLPRFCPKEHRPVIIEKFRRHICQHPAIPFDDVDGTYLTADEIYEGAVRDLYDYCFAFDLSQVFAYMWNCWYAPDKWALWARSASPLISKIRTTMIVESLWRHLKHDTLAAFSRPRLDLVVHLLITQVLAAVKRKLNHILGHRRVGRPSALAPWQKTFKSEWKWHSSSDSVRSMEKERRLLKLNPKSPKAKASRNERLVWVREEADREPGEYHTSIENWTCSCPSYLLSRFLLCKHLVRATNDLNKKYDLYGLAFFKKLRRYHTAPFYHIPGIHPTEPDADFDTHEDDISENESGNSGSDDDDNDDDAAADEPVATPRPLLPVQATDTTDPRSPSLGDEGDSNMPDNGTGKVHFSEAEKQHHQDIFAFVSKKYFSDTQGMHPSLKRRLDSALGGLSGVVADIRKAEGQRKRRRTWADNTVEIMYILD